MDIRTYYQRQFSPMLKSNLRSNSFILSPLRHVTITAPVFIDVCDFPIYDMDKGSSMAGNTSILTVYMSGRDKLVHLPRPVTRILTIRSDELFNCKMLVGVIPGIRVEVFAHRISILTQYICPKMLYIHLQKLPYNYLLPLYHK